MRDSFSPHLGTSFPLFHVNSSEECHVIDNANYHIFVTRYHDTLAYWISKHAVVTITRNLGGPAIVRKTGIKVTISPG